MGLKHPHPVLPESAQRGFVCGFPMYLRLGSPWHSVKSTEDNWPWPPALCFHDDNQLAVALSAARRGLPVCAQRNVCCKDVIHPCVYMCFYVDLENTTEHLQEAVPLPLFLFFEL